MLTPSYLTTNQSEECPRADHTPHNLPSLTLSLKTFKNPSPESFWGVWAF